MSTDPYPANPRLMCRACNTRGMANYEHHVKSTAHQQKVARFVTRLADEEQLLVGLNEQATNAIATPVTPLMEPDLDPEPDPPDIIRPPSPLSYLRSLDAADILGPSFGNHLNPSDDLDGQIRYERLRQALETLDRLDFDEDDNHDLTEEESDSQDPNLARARAQEAIEWHPFKNKEDLLFKNGLASNGCTINPLGPVKTNVVLPEILQDLGTDTPLRCIDSVTLPSGQSVRALDFVLLHTNSTPAQVQSIWIPDGKAAIKTVLVMKQCTKGRLVPFYGMREILKGEHVFARGVKDVVTVINVQHNCHEGKCKVTMSHTKKIERKVCDVLVSGITHADTNSFIINSAAQYSGEVHRRIAEVNLTTVNATQWNSAIQEGLKAWNEASRGAKKQKQTQDTNESMVS
ncbi:uncharacterized protein MELLADRAFT_111397 [Melampsora larici-populina 98AG31]|uniref:Uncharacterized protein n=1 Tax=Melampsora larici-populina (strain 98AG31 / pathotype 3-4-7) TaxID=747676 RepID=F4S326_MELLP|nr:uncharacterized protein MELLADRAFT_111397 [Melampsora larici-populina 98AG31]EGG00905.1 hypothetical protein MELLADRAFT_111397 [Melampsora larici-populina 98AG31]